MTNKTLRTAIPTSALLLSLLLVGVTADAQRSGRGGGRETGQGVSTRLAEIETTPLSSEEVGALLFLREEEKLARDVYITLVEAWGQRIFSNISSAEQRHMDQVLTLLETHEIPDPVTDDTVGVFTDERLTELYGTLVAQGLESMTEALRVGAAIEDLDLADLEELLTVTDNAQVELVAENLARGTRNHMRAFMRQLEAQGGTYTPQHISQEAFDAILEGEQERGGGWGRGNGRGQGNSWGRSNGRGQGNGWGRGSGQGRGNGWGRRSY